MSEKIYRPTAREREYLKLEREKAILTSDLEEILARAQLASGMLARIKEIDARMRELVRLK